MRTTVRIDDDLLQLLREKADSRNVSFNKLLNEVLRGALVRKTKGNQKYKLPSFAMGPPLVDVTKALSLAAEWDDEEIVQKLANGK